MNNELKEAVVQRVDWMVSSEEFLGTKGKYENIQYLEEMLLVSLFQQQAAENFS